MSARVSAILLASGLSERMGFDKLSLPYKGKSLIQRAIDLLYELPVFEKIVVTTNKQRSMVDIPEGIDVVINARPEVGQSESLRLGVSAASGDHYLFLVADQPMLTVDCLLPLLECAIGGDGKIVYPVVDGMPCSPSIFPSCFRGELLALDGDTGGRAVREAFPEACLAVEAVEPWRFADVDKYSDYQALN